jgi:hypothetical protein
MSLGALSDDEKQGILRNNVTKMLPQRQGA